MKLLAATISLSSFLLFLIQPIIGKQILPWFGGAAAVWTTCLVFFQLVLLGGYAYADWSTRRLSPSRQALLHGALLALSLLTLPVLADASWKPIGSENPTLRILGMLAATIGLPYFLLSTTGPLVQAWFACALPGRSPYRLFALSNLMSVLGLLCYPVGVEPWLASALQAKAWSAAYAVFALLCALAAIRGARAQPAPAGVGTAADRVAAIAPSPAERLRWLGYAAMGSLLLLAVSNHLCMNIASIPFLWVLPLALYLASFILCFDGRGWYRRVIFVPLAAIALVLMAGFLVSSKLTLNLKLAVPVYALGMFVCCMVCHGELAARRPAPRYLTGFYLMVSLGGALGAVLVGVLAPLLLPGYFELGFGLLAIAALLARRCWRVGRWAGATGAVVVALVAGFWAKQIDDYASSTRVMARNFYGSLRTWDTATSDTREPIRKFVHGAILHGEQFLDADRRMDPTTYYSETSGIGRLLLDVLDQPQRRVGVIGLGAGTLAAYGRVGDAFRFYEINPRVIEIAYAEFSFLTAGPAQVEVALGDARLNLERDPPQNFDVLVVDAFSGDAIPVHLITREAMAVYLRHIRPGGVIAFHVTNRYLDLPPVVARIAEHFALATTLVSDDPEGDDTDAYSRTDWVLVSAHRRLLADPALAKTSVIAVRPDWRPWTDDFNNLYGILR